MYISVLENFFLKHIFMLYLSGFLRFVQSSQKQNDSSYDYLKKDNPYNQEDNVTLKTEKINFEIKKYSFNKIKMSSHFENEIYKMTDVHHLLIIRIFFKLLRKLKYFKKFCIDNTTNDIKFNELLHLLIYEKNLIEVEINAINQFITIFLHDLFCNYTPVVSVNSFLVFLSQVFGFLSKFYSENTMTKTIGAHKIEKFDCLFKYNISVTKIINISIPTSENIVGYGENCNFVFVENKLIVSESKPVSVAPFRYFCKKTYFIYNVIDYPKYLIFKNTQNDYLLEILTNERLIFTNIVFYKSIYQLILILSVGDNEHDLISIKFLNKDKQINSKISHAENFDILKNNENIMLVLEFIKFIE